MDAIKPPTVPPTPPATVAEREAADAWTVADAAELYGIDRWGGGYFGINDAGRVVVTPNGHPAHHIDLMALVDDLRDRDIEPPLLLRFSDILRHRITQLADAFTRAIDELEYQGTYQAVYPIKVNQQRHVVEEVLRFGREHGFGLEAGSKPELLAVMALVDDSETPIICNGFKDEQFIEAVILSTKLGRNIIPVVEKFSELETIIRHAELHGVRPKIGVRVKLSARGAGRWEQSGGERSKFGLFISEILEAVELLRKHDMLDCLKLVHFHLGSQINEIRAIKQAIVELVRVYAQLKQLGAGLEYIDVGGGLGVDYDGLHATVGGSINYSLQEYANNVVYHVRNVCDDAGVEHPKIISESGRAMVAYHSVLVFNAIGWSGFERFETPGPLEPADREGMPKPVRELIDMYHGIDADSVVEDYHDAQLARDDTLNLFNLGFCSLQHRGLAERAFYGLCGKAARLAREMENTPADLEGLDTLLSDIYFCNLSIFQSMPDAWAIDQVFPVMPIHRLNERPTCRGIIADITCDSDGKLDRFVPDAAGEPPQRVLPLHPLDGNGGGDYFIAAFLVGAYQEILGDLHNLLGDTNAVHVMLDEETGEVVIDEVVEGDTVAEALGYVQFSPEELRRTFRQSVERAVREKKLTVEQSRSLRRFYEQGLSGYTYLT